MDQFARTVLKGVSWRFQRSVDKADMLLLHRSLGRIGLSSAWTIPTHTTEAERRTLFALAAACPAGAAALEIGSYLGASCCYIAAGLARHNGHLFCVDTWNNETMEDGPRDTFAEFERNIEAVRARVTPVRKRSGQLTEQDVRTPLHLVFLDGDHSYETVREELERVGPWIAQDGILALHDAIPRSGVSRVAGEALATGQWQFAGNVDHLIWLRKSPPPYDF